MAVALNLLLGFLLGSMVVLLLLAAFVLARGYERAEQREERHRLKAELAAAKVLLAEHGIPFGDETNGEE